MILNLRDATAPNSVPQKNCSLTRAIMRPTADQKNPLQPLPYPETTAGPDSPLDLPAAPTPQGDSHGPQNSTQETDSQDPHEPLFTMTSDMTSDMGLSLPMADMDTPAKPSLLAVLLSALKEVAQIIVPAITLTLIIHLFLAQATVVYGQSMQPNLQPMERLVIEKLSYYLHDPGRAEIVVLDLPQMQELMIKRIIGLPGETVEIRQGRVYINGIEAPEPYDHAASDSFYGPITLEADTYFVLGDNRNNSNDSRSFGPIHRSSITGRAWLRYWPLPRFTIFQ